MMHLSSQFIWALGLLFTSSQCLAHPTDAHSPRITSAPTAVLDDRAVAATTTTDKIAASYSMIPASIPVLPLPTGALHAADAQAYIKTNWGYISGESEYIAFAPDPFDSTNKDRVFRVSYPAGTYANSPKGDGGVGMYLNPFGDVNAQRAMFSYEVAFSEDFEFVQGGKLLGLFGGKVGDHCSGAVFTDTCFSLRIVWRQDGDGEVYAYIPHYPGFDSLSDIGKSGNYGYSINRGSWKFTKTAWQKVTLVAIINSDPGTPTTANGGIAVYINDEHIFTHNYFVLSTNSSVDVSSIFLSTFFGGNTEEYASEGGYAYFRNLRAYYGTQAATATGKTVTATMGAN